MANYIFSLVFGLATAVTIFYLLRNGRMREKYATIWVAVAIVVAVLSVFPGVLNWVADVLGVLAPVNIVFFLGALALLVISVQYSVELSSLEERTRTLAEEVAILRSDLEELQRPATGDDAPPTSTP